MRYISLLLYPALLSIFVIKSLAKRLFFDKILKGQKDCFDEFLKRQKHDEFIVLCSLCLTLARFWTCLIIRGNSMFQCGVEFQASAGPRRRVQRLDKNANLRGSLVSARKKLVIPLARGWDETRQFSPRRRYYLSLIVTRCSRHWGSTIMQFRYVRTSSWCDTHTHTHTHAHAHKLWGNGTQGLEVDDNLEKRLVFRNRVNCFDC